ncbi:hypothetical protein ABQX22_07300 [Xanthomonas sp. WHRI 1810A]|uniref:hypothetical protein n=1 Tax=Xanthomonas sp. WHRI 1810A TaxID=3161565 RepID=UPI0032E85BEC
MITNHLPALTFPSVNYGAAETRHDLRCLVYENGVVGNVRNSKKLLASKNKRLLVERLPLVVKIHEVLNGKIVGGGSPLTLRGKIVAIRAFFRWAEERRASITIESIENLYLAWADYLWERFRNGAIDGEHATNLASKLGSLIDEILGFNLGLHSRTPFCKSKIRSRNRSRMKKASEKLDLPRAFEFGRFLHDVTRSLTIENIQSTIPVVISLSDGRTLKEYLRYKPGSKNFRVAAITSYTPPADIITETFSSRYPLINLRVMAELLIFISQTAINLAEARKLKVGKFSYKGLSDGYEVRRIYKNRKKGAVEFEIFSGYKEIFEHYLKWRNELYPLEANDLLFPFFSHQRKTFSDFAPSFEAVKSRCEMLGITSILARNLRKLKLNWFARQTKNLQLTLEQGQHTKETYFRHYHIPNFQMALVEISSFYKAHDPTLQAAGAGGCSIASPLAISAIPKHATVPDCISPAGCLFCASHRDIDSQDHAWSLASYRHYKTLELATYKSQLIQHNSNPCALAIDAVTSKLRSFAESNQNRAKWVKEALDRVAESHYHPKWDGFIQLLEAADEDTAQY